MGKISSKKGVYILGGISGIIILVSIILISELGAVQYGGDTGAFLWTTFHFVINPILSVAYIVLTITKWIRVKEKARYLYTLGIAVALMYIYFSVSGNTLWLDLLGIDFN